MRLVACFLLASTGSAAADRAVEPEPTMPEPPPPTPFDRGKMNLGLAGGSGNTAGQRYFAIGAGFGYFVLDGLELGVSALYQFGDGPDIAKTAPQIRYVAKPLVGKWPLIPYAGVFYNHWFIGDAFPDVDAIGARTGLLYISGHILLGLGIAVEKTVSECVDECTDVYPDLTISLAF